MRTYFSMLLMAAVVSFLLTPLARRIAFFIGAVDRPDPRKIHRRPTARLGGLAVIGGFCAPWLLLYALDNRVSQVLRQNQMIALTLILAGVALFLVGVVDDIRGLRAVHKLIIQIAVAVGMYWGGFHIDRLNTPIYGEWQLGWLSLPVTVLWIVGLTNATNLLDGMDGLVAGVAAVLALSLAMINILGGNIIVALMTFSLAGAALGFLPYNFSPARIFLGDCGSLFVGVMMAGISTLSFFKAATATLLLVPLLLFALPLYDTIQVVVGRLRRGHHPFSPDKTHIHHQLLDLGLNSRQAATLLYIVALFLGISAIFLSWRIESRTYVGIALAGLFVALVVAVITRRPARPTPGPGTPSLPVTPGDPTAAPASTTPELPLR